MGPGRHFKPSCYDALRLTQVICESRIGSFFAKSGHDYPAFEFVFTPRRVVNNGIADRRLGEALVDSQSSVKLFSVWGSHMRG